MKDISDLQVFVKIIEKGSFSAAGRELRMSAAVVSSRVARLESRLDVRLFNRTTRKVSPTDNGRRYYADCLDILSRMAEAERRLSHATGKTAGILRLSAATSFCQHYLAEAISRFARRYPDIQIQLQTTDRLADLLEEGLDLAIRIGPMVDSSFKSRILAPGNRYILAAPEYLEKYGAPQHPKDLTDHNCLLLRFPGSRQFKWTFQEGGGLYDLNISGALDSNSGEVLHQWALAGHGLTLKSGWEVAGDIAAGRLKIVLGDYMPRNIHIHSISAYDKYSPPRVSHFIDFIARDMKQDPRFSDLP